MLREALLLRTRLAKYDKSIKELRDNAQFTAVMNVNAFVESLKKSASSVQRSVANNSGAQQLWTLVKEAGLDPESPRPSAPTKFQIFMTSVPNGGRAPALPVSSSPKTRNFAAIFATKPPPVHSVMQLCTTVSLLCPHHAVSSAQCAY